jgi:MFS family permease
VFGALLYGGTLIAPIVGVWSDRVGHRNMLSGMRAIYAVVAAILMTLAFSGRLRPELVLVLATFTGLVRPSDMGLRGAMIADTMPGDTLTAAMGIARTTSDTARIAGALTGAGMFAAIGIGPSYIVVTAFYLLGALLTWNATPPAEHAPPHPAAEAAPQLSSWRELYEGIVMVWNTPRLLAIVWYALLFNFAVFPLTNGLMPYAAKEIFSTDQTGLGYLVASVAFGAFIGSIAITRSGLRINLARLMIVAAVIWHILVLIFAQTHTMPAAIVMLMLAGLAQSLTMVCHTVILLRASNQRYRGRVMGVRMLAIYSLPVGLLVAGALIGWIGFRATASIYAVVGLVFTILIAVRWRASLWQARTLEDGV